MDGATVGRLTREFLTELLRLRPMRPEYIEIKPGGPIAWEKGDPPTQTFVVYGMTEWDRELIAGDLLMFVACAVKPLARAMVEKLPERVTRTYELILPNSVPSARELCDGVLVRGLFDKQKKVLRFDILYK